MLKLFHAWASMLDRTWKSRRIGLEVADQVGAVKLQCNTAGSPRRRLRLNPRPFFHT
jgi:hypothetical protein